ncbi:uncharacterized protein BO87DRAFT_402287 [Aspergillus neoniger CBS 115656]|uniref:Uncharacterized protein n=1 Tax=Aspergillus neoniger (strain CBS 115656) TaxID=1448310 RepID=A0A318Y1X2_ASPNB|nr:hypothetical protein BO87DRAFT_402287 [Aspergillus neoniger CBS 115656]PYH28371.1 hypothetical protein BO87DRAFT_402287 [Aspergillus neoniger CBS 115656]
MEFDKSILNKVKHNTKIIINDIEYQGFRIRKANNGLLTSQLNHNLNFDPEILAVHLIIGYLSYSEYKEGATDLFKPSTLLDGYKYQQKYRFSSGATFSSFHNISFEERTDEAFAGQTWDVQDLVETFIPSGPDLVKSIMVVKWKGDQRNLSAGIYIQCEKITVHRDFQEVGGEPENLLAIQLPVETKGREKAREEAEAPQLNAAIGVSTF